MAKDLIIKENKKIREAFIELREIPKQYKVPFNAVPFGYVYCIENLTNGKKYIGSVYSIWTGTQPSLYSQLSKRASNYIHEYNYTKNNIDAKDAKYTRPIIQAMITDGIENFRMYPLGETLKDNHFLAENYFMEKLNTIKNGYNVLKASRKNNFREVYHNHTASGKKLRSEPVVCINLNQKKIIHCDSMKLFGDYMNSSKDMIKNCVRSGRPYKGWFIFYTNEIKRLDILYDKVLNVNNKVQNKGENHSEKGRIFYKDLCNTIGLYLKSQTPLEYFPGFELLKSLEYTE